MTTDADPERAAPAGQQSLLRSWSLVATWIEVFADIKALMAAEIATAKLEASDNFRFLGLQAAKLVAALVLLAAVLVLLVAAAVVYVAGFIGTLAALLAVAALCLLVGVVLALSGGGRITARPLLPTDSIGRIGRDLKQIAGHKLPVSAPEGDRHEVERGAE